jgi:isochorismate synthase EntC
MRRMYGWLSIDGDFSVAVSVELKKQLSRHSPLDVAASMRCYLVHGYTNVNRTLRLQLTSSRVLVHFYRVFLSRPIKGPNQEWGVSALRMLLHDHPTNAIYGPDACYR